jgi:hypothetical protein
LLDAEAQKVRTELVKTLDNLPFYVKMSDSYVKLREQAKATVKKRLYRKGWILWFRRDGWEKALYFTMTIVATFLALPLYVAVILIKWVEKLGTWIIFVLGVANAITAIVGTVIGSSGVQIVSAFLGMGIMIVLAIKKAFVEGVNVELYNQKVKELAKPAELESQSVKPDEGAQPEEATAAEPLIKPQRYDEISGPWELGAQAMSWFFVFNDPLDRKDYVDHLTELVSASGEREAAVNRYYSILFEVMTRIEMSTSILDYMVNYIPGGLQGDIQILLMRMMQDWQAFSSQHTDQRTLNLIIWERQERTVENGEIAYDVPRKDLLMLIQSHEFWRLAEYFRSVERSETICAILGDSASPAEMKIRQLRDVIFSEETILRG